MLLVLTVVPAFGANSVARKKQIARTQFEAAERMREALNGRPSSERTLREYKKVIEAYRQVYYVAPTSVKADASAVAVAELLAEIGRRFDDDKSLKSAIGQYEFLRREYPGSTYRVQALFTIAQIYKDDLEDAPKARASFQEFLKRYSHSNLADDAQRSIAEIDHPVKEVKAAKQSGVKLASAAERETEEAEESTVAKKHRPLVTGIRHWSTPDYTRVAIDVEEQVQFDSARVPSPDRIYFDLHNTKLASTLVGKTFAVEDGFLHKIRVAQYQLGETRVVLEVQGTAEYSAFLLPNPYRLIVDIHGKNARAAATDPARMPENQSDPPAKSSGNSVPTVVVDVPANAPDVRQPAATTAKQGSKAATDLLAVRTEDAASGGKRTGMKSSSKENAQPDSANQAASDSKAADATPQQPAKLLPPDTPQPPLQRTSAETDTNSGGGPDKTRVKIITDSPAVKKPAPAVSTKSSRKKADGPTAREAKPTANGDRSLIRALGLKIGRIVVDAGHGGHDTGTIGPNGLMEKDLVLDVAVRLGKLLQSRMGAEVVYTRDDDTFIPLETRTAIANQNEADLFISVHANSSSDADARGVETYYLNFTSSRDALEVAARENAVSEKSIHELQDLVKKIALKEKIEESREFASDVQSALYSGLASKGLRNRGVKKAPFIVLIGANMPSILAEISFVSNPADAKRLKSPEYRQKIAESLYRGTAKYVSGLSGLKVASRTTAKNDSPPPAPN